MIPNKEEIEMKLLKTNLVAPETDYKETNQLNTHVFQIEENYSSISPPPSFKMDVSKDLLQVENNIFFLSFFFILI